MEISLGLPGDLPRLAPVSRHVRTIIAAGLQAGFAASSTGWRSAMRDKVRLSLAALIAVSTYKLAI